MCWDATGICCQVSWQAASVGQGMGAGRRTRRGTFGNLIVLK